MGGILFYMFRWFIWLLVMFVAYFTPNTIDYSENWEIIRRLKQHQKQQKNITHTHKNKM